MMNHTRRHPSQTEDTLTEGCGGGGAFIQAAGIYWLMGRQVRKATSCCRTRQQEVAEANDVVFIESCVPKKSSFSTILLQAIFTRFTPKYFFFHKSSSYKTFVFICLFVVKIKGIFGRLFVKFSLFPAVFFGGSQALEVTAIFLPLHTSYKWIFGVWGVGWGFGVSSWSLGPGRSLPAVPA